MRFKRTRLTRIVRIGRYLIALMTADLMREASLFDGVCFNGNCAILSPMHTLSTQSAVGKTLHAISTDAAFTVPSARNSKAQLPKISKPNGLYESNDFPPLFLPR
jgi:hypothetical protein